MGALTLVVGPGVLVEALQLTATSPPDTSFMYMIAGLCMLKLYQKRHPDINASAYSAYACLAVVIFFSVLGVVRPEPALGLHTHTLPPPVPPSFPSRPSRPLPLSTSSSSPPPAAEHCPFPGPQRALLLPSPPPPLEGGGLGSSFLRSLSPALGTRQVFGKGNTAFWIVFSVIHIVATLLLSIQLYYMGRWKLGEGRVGRGLQGEGLWPGSALSLGPGGLPG